MLVLTRKVKETLIIDNKIKITVVAVDGDKVKLAIDAPKDIPILRQEVFEAIEKENRESLNVSIGADELFKIKDLLP
ncbi:MAG TPA: carbon storage regulator CsrA [Clostridia bacterium]|nr:carbon storage regulator CsrA [Clostridia bacterium]